MMSRAEQWLAPEGDKAAAALALKWNKLAERCYPADVRPRMLARERTDSWPSPAAGPTGWPTPARVRPMLTTTDWTWP